MVTALALAALVVTVIVPLVAGALASDPDRSHRRPLARRIELVLVHFADAALARVARQH